MQRDMHYEGMYVLARAAGLAPEIALRVATSSQLVDDFASNYSGVLEQDGGWLSVFATSHHAVDGNNLLDEHQRRIWVPFHFLPGGLGSTLEERLVCVMDSPASQRMLVHHQNYPASEIIPELMGIAAHVYADTFAHYGFSGMASERNFVQQDSLSIDMDELTPQERARIEKKKASFFERLGGAVAEVTSGGLGHAGVAVWPDRPYLVWSFAYEDGKEERRDNPATYLAACAALYEEFQRLAARIEGGGEASLPFAAIEPEVRAVLAHQGDSVARSGRWADALASGALNGLSEKIPDYRGEAWNAECGLAQNCFDALAAPFCAFARAAEVHRTYVLRVLLPSMGMLVA